MIFNHFQHLLLAELVVFNFALQSVKITCMILFSELVFSNFTLQLHKICIGSYFREVHYMYSFVIQRTTVAQKNVFGINLAITVSITKLPT